MARFIVGLAAEAAIPFATSAVDGQGHPVRIAIPAGARIFHAPAHVDLVRKTPRSKNAHEAMNRISRTRKKAPAVVLPKSIPRGLGVDEAIGSVLSFNLMVDPP